MTSLRARLFAATLAALALTLALTIAIGAVLTRRQVDRSQASAVARQADDLAAHGAQQVSYVRADHAARRRCASSSSQPRSTFKRARRRT